MSTLDVIIVSYNTRADLLRCLESVFASTWSGTLKVFVVDNGSVDGSVEAVKGQFPQVRLMASNENLGFARANNLAIKESTADYVLLLNPDTVVDANSFTSSADYLARHPDAGMLSCKLVVADGSLDLACRRSFPTAWDGFCRASGLSRWFPRSRLTARYNLTFLSEDETYPVDAVNGAYMFCTRQAVDAVGPMDADYFMYAEDMDWCYRFWQAGYQVVYHPGTTTLHLKGKSSSARSAKMIRAMFQSNLLFCQKHYFAQHGRLWRLAVTAGLKTWELVALSRNYFRTVKTARP